MMSAQLQQPSDPATSAIAAASTSERPTEASQIPGSNSSANGASPAPLVNRAAQSKSPYVRSQSSSPVAWQLLDNEAVARARSENKLIFLSIGFLASHHCHLAHLESFSDSNLASLLNREFVPVLIDREEHPNYDYIYMKYNESLNSVGGWPLNVFLTPDLEPVFSGTYWAPPGATSATADEAEAGDKPLDWLTVVKKVHSAWKDEESRVREEARQNFIELEQVVSEGVVDHVPEEQGQPENARQSVPPIDYSQDIDGEVDLDQIEEAFARITRTFDFPYGGFGQHDKFLTPSKLSLMLRATNFPPEVRDVAGPRDCAFITDSALHTLRRIVHGAVHDHIGGGFHRHSITRDWSLPSFEKLLIDNALLLGLFLDAWLLSGGRPEDELAEIVKEVGDYMTSPIIMSDRGGFFTSEAADSYSRRGDPAMRNGAFYLWTRKEFDTAVGDQNEAEAAAAYWDVQAHGNVDSMHDPLDEFLNQNVLRIAKTYASLGKQLGISPVEVKQRVASAREKLRAYRERERVRPVVDTKIVAAYNGMAIGALARASAVLQEQDIDSAARYIAAATDAARFIKTALWDASEKILYRAYCDGRFTTKGFAEDYAYIIEGLLELYEATADESWLEWADELQAVQIKLFYDDTPSTVAQANLKCGGFYSTMQDAPHTIFRVKEGIDGSQPSVNSVSVSNLFRLGALLDDQQYTYLAKASINAFGAEMLEHPNLFPGLLCGVVPWRLGGRHWVAVGDKARASSLFHKAPRAALSTLRYHDPRDTTSWLRKRSPALDLDGEGIYIQDGKNAGVYRKIEDKDAPGIPSSTSVMEPSEPASEGAVTRS
ncbi:spermatogenesis-associated protein [Xylariaceae sp. FL0594]|nr:spermatogenesis-associated protein [Xylariaceae sp. FL0594]